MSRPHITVLVLLAVTLVGMPLVTACGATPTPTAAPPTAVPAKAATAVPPTQVPATSTPAPAVGGTLVWLLSTEPDTLDIGISAGAPFYVGRPLGETLVYRDPKDAKYVGGLAESWTVSEDGLTWEFRLRKGVKFHNGDPLTANDFVYTYTRAKDPATKSAAAGPWLAAVGRTEAPDDQTVRFVMTSTFYPFLLNLTFTYLQPLSRAAIEKYGEQYGRHPVGVGPYKFVDWVTGDHITLERNPDFTWAPPFAHQGPAYIQNMEFRFIPEPSTQVAGFEAGELDLAVGIMTAKDIKRFEDNADFIVHRVPAAGIDPFLCMNVSKPPFDDIRVRQAFNMAVDRDALIKIMLLGDGMVQNGPVSPPIAGYWPGVEQIGYKFDLGKAKALMAEAGYTPGPDGILVKDGQPLKLTLKTWTWNSGDKVAEVVQEQYKALGVALEISLEDIGILWSEVVGGNYEFAVQGAGGYEDVELMYMMFHSSQIGSLNASQVKDPELDKLLEATRTIMDPAKRQEAANAAQKYVVEKAYVIPLYASYTYTLVNSRIKGLVLSNFTAHPYFHDAYIETK